MADRHEIDRLLAEMAQDEAPLSDRLRAALIADAVAQADRPSTGAPWWTWLSGWGGAMGVPVAAIAGLWIGVSQPALVLLAVPGVTTEDRIVETADTEDGLLAEIFGEDWEEVEP